VYVTRLGPFGIAMALLAVAVIVAIFMIAILGAVVFWIPVIAAVVVVAAALRLLRRFGFR
ncbi:MAG: hypothetical protein ACRECE_00325, partial [Xanthobacteraceae bacterium]